MSDHKAIVRARGSFLSMHLSKLILQASLLDKGQWDQAYRHSISSGLPTGRILVLSNFLSEDTLAVALNMLVRLRDDAFFTFDDAVQILSMYQKETAPPLPADGHSALQDLGNPVSSKRILLGELLTMAGFVNRTDVLSALEISLIPTPKVDKSVKFRTIAEAMRHTWEPGSRGPLIGQVFVEQGWISTRMLESALEAQDKVGREVLNGLQAAAQLKKIRLLEKAP